MIVKLLGGPRDGQEIEIPYELIAKGYEIHLPELFMEIARIETCDIPPIPNFTASRYRPVLGEIGDLEFIGYR